MLQRSERTIYQLESVKDLLGIGFELLGGVFSQSIADQIEGAGSVAVQLVAFLLQKFPLPG
jgi:hypothetical protein